MVRFESNEVLPLLQKQEKFIEASRLNEVTIVGPNLLYKSEYLICFVDSHMENELPRYGVRKSSTGYFVENSGKQEIFLDNAVYLGSALDFLYYEAIVYTIAKFFRFIEITDRDSPITILINKSMSIKVRDWLVSNIGVYFPNSISILLDEETIVKVSNLQVFTLETELLDTNLRSLGNQIKSAIPSQVQDKSQNTKILFKRNKNVYYGMKSRKPRNHRIFELYALLKGYDLIDPGNMEFIEVLEKVSKAGKVVSYHGGSLVNILACGPGTRICEVYSEWYADCFEKIADYCDLDYVHYFYEMKKRPDLLRTTYYLLKNLEKKAYVKHFRIKLRDFNVILGTEK
jgi:hypothetical protein